MNSSTKSKSKSKSTGKATAPAPNEFIITVTFPGTIKYDLLSSKKLSSFKRSVALAINSGNLTKLLGFENAIQLGLEGLSNQPGQHEELDGVPTQKIARQSALKKYLSKNKLDEYIHKPTMKKKKTGEESFQMLCLIGFCVDFE